MFTMCIVIILAAISALLVLVALLAGRILLQDVDGSVGGSVRVDLSSVGVCGSDGGSIGTWKEWCQQPVEDLPDWEEEFETHSKGRLEEADPRHHRGRRDKHPKWMRSSAFRSREVMC